MINITQILMIKGGHDSFYGPKKMHISTTDVKESTRIWPKSAQIQQWALHLKYVGALSLNLRVPTSRSLTLMGPSCRALTTSTNFPPNPTFCQFNKTLLHPDVYQILWTFVSHTYNQIFNQPSPLAEKQETQPTREEKHKE